MIPYPESLIQKRQQLNLIETQRVLVVFVAQQKMGLYENRKPLQEYQISTAKNGVGQKINSYRTPLGLHFIREKIGGEVPEGAIFKERKWTGELWKNSYTCPKTTMILKSMEQKEDLITSRILWLEGLEPGVNLGKDSAGICIDSFQRYIYIHGTNHEEKIGRPESYGCIRMKNHEVISLFEIIQEKDWVWIQE